MISFLIYGFYVAFIIFISYKSYFSSANVTYWWNFSSKDKVSTVFNMMIANKVSKEINKLGVNKIFKRHIFFASCDKKESKIVNVLEKVGINKADAEQITKHPMVVAEAKDGSMYITNLTSSENVEGKKTVFVGYQKTGKPNRLVERKIQQVSKEDSSLVQESVKEVNNYKFNIDLDSLNKLANNTGNVIEATIGKELKNKNYESINMLKKTMIEKI